jgi:hypothetical protein
MRRTQIGFTSLALGALGLAAAAWLAAGSVYASSSNTSLVTLDPPGSIDTRPFGITSTGDIVGTYFTADQRAHGFFLTRGVYTSIDPPGSVRTTAAGITVLRSRRSHNGDDDENVDVCGGHDGHDQEKHERGLCQDLAIVGRYDTPDGKAHGYLLGGGTVTTIDFPGATFTVATGINPSGHIVGRYRSPDGMFHGFTLIDGSFTTIDYPGAISIQAMAINEEGDIAGYYVDAGGVFHGFLLTDGYFTTFDPPDSIATGMSGGILGINSRGEIAGCYTTADGVTHGFVLRNGRYTSFDIRERFTSNTGVNRQGDIVGLFEDATGRRHGFLAPRGTED